MDVTMDEMAVSYGLNPVIYTAYIATDQQS